VDLKRLALPVLAVAATASAAPAAALTRRHTGAGDRLAAGVLLPRSDLGRRWAVSAPPASPVPPLTCPGFAPPTPGVVEDGAAASPTFQAGDTGPFVSQVAYAYGSPGQRAAFWHRVIRRRLLRCIAQSFIHSSSSGVRFAVTHQRLLGAPELGVPAAGYRVAGTATYTGQSDDVYLDVFAIGGGSSVSELSIASFGVPPVRALELRLGRILAARLSAP
jgi:hypothetical protein